MHVTVYDNVGQRTLLTIATDQLKCTPLVLCLAFSVIVSKGRSYSPRRNVAFEPSKEIKQNQSDGTRKFRPQIASQTYDPP